LKCTGLSQLAQIATIGINHAIPELGGAGGEPVAEKSGTIMVQHCLGLCYTWCPFLILEPHGLAVFISGLTNQQVSLLKDNFLNGILC
jgi:hypothetical protein